MNKLLRPSILGFVLVLICPLSLHAQTVPADAKPSAAASAPRSQAPEEATRKISELVHAGKYAEAQQLTNGLLIAYPGDQRLIKAKALIDSRLASGNSASAALVGSQPAQPAANANAAQLTGMDKVDYNALIVLARQAQQTTDLDEQKKMLKQFMDQSGVFLQKHPKQMLLWQLRAASAISSNEPLEGYEAGQQLLAMGGADSNDPPLQQLLAQLKNKGWLDQREVERQTKFGWILGTWTVHSYVTSLNKGGGSGPHKDLTIDFSMSNSSVEGYYVSDDGSKLSTIPFLRSTISDKGEIGWERHYGNVWHPIAFRVSGDKRTIGFTDRVSWIYGGKNWSADEVYTLNVSSK